MPRAVLHRKRHKDCREETCYLANYMRSGNLPGNPQFHDPGKANESHTRGAGATCAASPQPPSIGDRPSFTFHFCSQEGETVSQFVAEHRCLSEHCAFDVSLHDMLRDWLVCSVHDPRVQRQLLAELNLAFKKAFEICQSAEVAEKNARELQMSRKHKVPSLLGKYRYTPRTVAIRSSSLAKRISWHTQRRTIVVQSSCCRRLRHAISFQKSWNSCTLLAAQPNAMSGTRQQLEKSAQPCLNFAVAALHHHQ